MIDKISSRQRVIFVLLILTVETILATGTIFTNQTTRLDIRHPSRLGYRRIKDLCDGKLITGLSVYNATGNTTNKLDILKYESWSTAKTVINLQAYPEGKINIIVDTKTCTAKPIQCTKIMWGENRTTYDKTAPYTLYGHNAQTGSLNVMKPKRGWQSLQVSTYSSNDCTGDATDYLLVAILVVPKMIVTYPIGPLTAIYHGTNATNATPTQTKVTVKAACQYTYQGLHVYFYRSNIAISRFKCWRVVPTSSMVTLTPLSIIYKMSIEFKMYSINMYSADMLPTRRKILDDIYYLFESSAGYVDPPTATQVSMTRYVTNELEPTNPFASYTSVTLFE